MADTETLDRMVSMLPYYLRNGENIKKVYKAFAAIFDELFDAVVEVMDSRDIDKAFGFGLDILGDIVGETRQGQNDEDFRERIRTKTVSNRSDGSIETVNNFGRLIFKDFYEGILQGKNPAEIILRYTFPSTNNAVAIMKKAVPAGVSITTQIDTYVPVCGAFTCGTLALTKTMVTTE